MKSDMSNQEIAEVFQALATSEAGLDVAEVLRRQEQYGRNEIDSSDGPHPWRILADQFKSFIIYILLFAVFFALAIGEYVDSLIIIIIVVINAAIGFFQELGAAKSLAALKKMTTVQATVHRQGRWQKVEAAELVPGDIIRLAAGDKVPADCRLFTDAVFAVEEASLTGESLPVEKTSAAMPPQAPLAEQRNMVFSSTAVVSGNATAVVVKTGMETEIGVITRLIKEAADEMTPLQKRLHVFGQRLVWVIVGVCVMVFAASALKEMVWGQGLSRELFVSLAFIAISLAVAAVPTALPAVVTIALSIGVKRLLSRKALVRQLSAVETLGSCDVICTDKTGTITKNEMTVRRVWTLDQEYELEGGGYNPEEGRLALAEVPLVIQSGFFCNNATLFEEGGHWRITGNPTEAALLVAAAKCGFEQESRRLAELPFDSDRKRMSVLVAREGGEEMFCKGGADGLLDSCSHALLEGRLVALDQELRDRITSRIDQYAGQAMRVLAFAWKKLEGRHDFVEENLVFVGLQAMIDPPRPEVTEALRLSRKAGVRVIMITGDYPTTALAIGQAVGIESGGVLTGAEMDTISDEELAAALDRGVNIFARVVPQHKQRIVAMLQQQNHTVAMTGDGVNDAPALKKANIGIAVGSGTDVAKEAADFVLLDDSFAHIVGAIEEGRGIYDNIQKSIMLLLSGNLGEVLIVFLAVLLGMNLPLTAVMLLWINMVTDGAPALAYSVDGYSDQVMARPPKAAKEGILPGDKLLLLLVLGVVGACIALGLFLFSGGSGADGRLTLARTMVFNFVVCYEMILVFVIRWGYGVPFFSNPFVWLSVLVSFAMQGLILYSPLAPFFGVVPLGPDNLLHLGVASLLFALLAALYQSGSRLWLTRRASRP